MEKLAALLGMATALGGNQSEVVAQDPMLYEASKASFHGVQFSGDPRKAARNHHRRMKASGRHNWRKA